MIPITILTGFLGSGKTTILANLLRQPGFGDTAVIINEFGDVGLDHELIETSDEDLVTLKTGCLCCKMRGDLPATLDDLLAKRTAGTVPPFTRVVIETSGLADPAPIVQSLLVDDAAAASFSVSQIATAVDSVTGRATLEREPEAVKQVALADQILLTKTDLAESEAQGLASTLRNLNRFSPITTVVHGELEPASLFQREQSIAGDRMLAIDEALSGDAAAPPHTAISTFSLVRDAPIPAAALTLFLEALADHCGSDLLRLKGLIQIAEHPAQPAVIHGVQHVFHPPRWLDAWPSEDRRTRMVFIARGIREDWVRALLGAIELEITDLTNASRPK